MEYNSPYATPESDLVTEQENTYQPKFFAFKGRIGRLRYLAYSTGSYFIFGVFAALVAAISSYISQSNGSEFSAGLYPFIMVLLIPFVILIIAFSVRRANDLDHTGWIILIGLIPYVGWIFNLYLVFASGSTEPNKYGSAPCENPSSVKILGLVIPFIMIIGIAAAVGIPAYQQYVSRAAGV